GDRTIPPEGALARGDHLELVDLVEVRAQLGSLLPHEVGLLTGPLLGVAAEVVDHRVAVALVATDLGHGLVGGDDLHPANCGRPARGPRLGCRASGLPPARPGRVPSVHGMPNPAEDSLQASMQAPLQYAVLAPVAAGRTAGPEGITRFAQHVERCGFE